ncbi:unnamed protein product [Didymodactylos carnosus]|uniref:Uncharacterized protein n=1 Tax=Didymodactylos carnosus TaxID=1234261 RepID=A0A815Y1T1_9BILA|nr:unnamed protein product [Didymodactylos carnosus]CAF4426503.1 unnamed protein product [Didymodactylos carnosus]
MCSTIETHQKKVLEQKVSGSGPTYTALDFIKKTIDEVNCEKLEINECQPDEYRCVNGRCIPKTFFDDDYKYPDCMDYTDEWFGMKLRSACYLSPLSDCEEHLCDFKEIFACGDGNCVNSESATPQCENGRDMQTLS